MVDHLTTGANVSKKSIPAFCLNPFITILALCRKVPSGLVLMRKVHASGTCLRSGGTVHG